MTIRCLLSAIAVGTGWIAVLAAVMVMSDDAPAALVLFPDGAFLAALPDDVSITGRNAISVTLTGDAATLYRAGAWLVLPAGLLGCAPLTS